MRHLETTRKIDPVNKTYADSVPGIAAMLPSGLERALDVGCSGGGLGHYLKQQHGYTHVAGIEFSAAAAEKARKHLDAVFVGDAGNLVLPVKYEAFFDVIFYADVLEHLYDPWSAIALHLPFLRPGGYVIASIPNINNLFILLNMLAGRFDYTEYGLLDRTHIRFFTSSTALEMFTSNGLTLMDFRRSFPDAAWHAEMNASRPPDPNIIAVYDKIYRKFAQGQDCSQDLNQCFGLFSFSKEAVADLFTAQFQMLFQLKNQFSDEIK